MNKWATDANIMKLRGLGYSQKEIGKKLNMSQGQILYALHQIKKRAENEGVDNVFIELCIKLCIPKILKYL